MSGLIWNQAVLNSDVIPEREYRSICADDKKGLTIYLIVTVVRQLTDRQLTESQLADKN